jgi:hypothetical protein
MGARLVNATNKKKRLAHHRTRHLEREQSAMAVDSPVQSLKPRLA